MNRPRSPSPRSIEPAEVRRRSCGCHRRTEEPSPFAGFAVQTRPRAETANQGGGEIADGDGCRERDDERVFRCRRTGEEVLPASHSRRVDWRWCAGNRRHLPDVYFAFFRGAKPTEVAAVTKAAAPACRCPNTSQSDTSGGKPRRIQPCGGGQSRCGGKSYCNDNTAHQAG